MDSMEENLTQVVGKNLASLRKAKGLTQIELANQIHYSDKSISKWELGNALPPVDVLLDFAHFYGVSLDYLVTEQKPEDIEKTVQQEEVKDKNSSNKAIVLAMSMAFIFLVACSVFFSSLYFQSGRLLWPLFFWMVPAGCLIAAIETRLMYHNRMAVTVLISCFVWSLFLCFCVQFAYFNSEAHREHIWFILIAAIPIQVIIILLHNYKRS